MERIAVISTQSNRMGQVMSIGLVIADCLDYLPLEFRYYILTPEFRCGGIHSNALLSDPRLNPIFCSREEALSDLGRCLRRYAVGGIFACGPESHKARLPELADCGWYDILSLACYRQCNPAIPADAPCYGTGRLKGSCSPEIILRWLLEDGSYALTHNACLDALDALKILRILGLPIGYYRDGIPKNPILLHEMTNPRRWEQRRLAREKERNQF